MPLFRMFDNHQQLEEFSNVIVIGEMGSRVIEFKSTTHLNQVVDLVGVLRISNAAISIYDPIYPSPSDPGAYIDYTLEKAVGNNWSMTLGNHGWTGGIYQIDDETIALQIFNLWNTGLMAGLNIDTGRIFSHYDQKSENRNIEMIYDIRNLHKN